MLKEDSLPTLIDTKYIIFNNCRKDHFNYVNELPPKKQHSLYQTQMAVRGKENPKHRTQHRSSPREHVVTEVMERSFQMRDQQKQLISPLTSIYKKSFEVDSTLEPPEKAHEQATFFLKQEHVQPVDSVYKKMSTYIREQNKGLYSLEKGRRRCDNLGIPKYNKLSSSSIYKSEFKDKKFEKLPAINQRPSLTISRTTQLKRSINKNIDLRM